MTNISPFPRRSRLANGRTLPLVATAEGKSGDTCDRERTFHFWRGTSNRRYVHIVHDLFDCPELGATNYVLVRVEANGRRTPLRIGRTTSRHGSENLAEIRAHAARLGAREVHLHVLADDVHDQTVVQWDLQTAVFGALVCEGPIQQAKKTVGA